MYRRHNRPRVAPMTLEINKNKSSLAQADLAELKLLIGASSDRALLPGENERLELILAANPEARTIYTAYMQLDAGLDWKIRGSQSVEEVLERSRQTASCSMGPGRLTQALRPVLTRMRSFSLLALAASLAF